MIIAESRKKPDRPVMGRSPLTLLFAQRARGCATRVPSLHVVEKDLLELVHEPVALEGRGVFAVYVDGRFGILGSARQRDPDIRVLRLTGSVHHAAHHRDVHFLDARILATPLRHHLPDVVGDVLRHLLEKGAGGAAAPGAGRHLGFEVTNAQRLEHLLSYAHLFGPVATRPRRQ